MESQRMADHANNKKPRTWGAGLLWGCGQYWTRTSDLYHVKVAL